MRKIILILVGLGFLLPTAYIRAQSVDPGAIRERGSETQEYYRLEEILRERKIPEKGRIKDRTEEAAKPEPETAEQTIFISRIDAGPSAILSADEIRDITGGYEGKNVSIRDLFDVVRRINELYARKSVAARAVLPPQKVEKGVVRIDLIEGRVGEITVENNRYTRDSFFTKRTSLKTGDIVKLDTLEKDLLFLNSTSDVDIRAELRPGGALGTTDCILKVREPENYQAALFSDNAGNDTVGLYRFGLMLGSKSLLGYRDSLLINSFFTAKGGTVAGSAAYSFPAGTLGTRLGLSYDYNQIEVISGPYKVLDISGESSDLGLELSHPLLVKPDFRLNGLAGFHAKKSATDFDGERLSSTRVRTINAGIDALSLDAGGYWYTRHRFTQGLHVSGGDVEYLAYNPLLLRQQILGRDVVLLLRARAQLTRKKLLPPSEQFQIGGASSVRGYPEGFLIGDKGYLVNVELSFPLPSSENGVFTADIANRLKGIAFIDHGGAFPYKPGGGSMTHRDYITGAGVGLAVNVSKFLTGRVSLGIPVTNRGSLEDKYVFHFYIQSDLF
ncbi:MAG TPA: ShlB/FhaC/HecB family hemolysin secretion/activation protein [Desulfomonilia bacterium]|nr:ShlB/FhaC/HecB family hemolysin secretion/activation protein [Desulfomonilia bacterium]